MFVTRFIALLCDGFSLQRYFVNETANTAVYSVNFDVMILNFGQTDWRAVFCPIQILT